MKTLDFIFAAAWLVACGPAFCEEPPPPAETPESLIDELAEVSKLGYGYSALFSGTQFLPHSDSENVHALVLGSEEPTKSHVLDALVRQGIKAVPALLKHLDDGRATRIPRVAGMDWISFADEYDFNRRTRKLPPAGVNRELLIFGDEHDINNRGGGRPPEGGDRHSFGGNQPSSHAITIGDLCFVALGQIVNRSFNATRYQPTGGLVVSSPTHSQRLCAVVREDWQGLSETKHRELLVQDFLEPDQADRRIGAYRRLAYFYPEEVEALVLRQLGVPTYDASEALRFVREVLCPEKSAVQQKKLFNDFVKNGGAAVSDGILLQLFSDLHMQELYERDDSHQPPNGRCDARSLLSLLYAYPNDAKGVQMPFVDTWEDTDMASFVGALVHDRSTKVGDAVKQVFLDHPNSVDFGPKCLRCLASRGFAPFLVEQLRGIDVSQTSANPLHLNYIEAIRGSREDSVQQQFLAILKTTRSDAYFLAALPGIAQPDQALVLDMAKRVLDGLPEHTHRAGALLGMVGELYPEGAVKFFGDFLKAGGPSRAETVCVLLRNRPPLAKVILAPLLDDKRELEGFHTPTRVCDRAAQEISHTMDRIEFDCEWDIARKDDIIRKLKAGLR